MTSSALSPRLMWGTTILSSGLPNLITSVESGNDKHHSQSRRPQETRRTIACVCRGSCNPERCGGTKGPTFEPLVYMHGYRRYGRSCPPPLSILQGPSCRPKETRTLDLQTCKHPCQDLGTCSSPLALERSLQNHYHVQFHDEFKPCVGDRLWRSS